MKSYYSTYQNSRDASTRIPLHCASSEASYQDANRCPDRVNQNQHRPPPNAVLHTQYTARVWSAQVQDYFKTEPGEKH